MKKILLIAALFVNSGIALHAQDVDIDKKTGIIQVDGKDAFCLTPKNKQIMICDYSLENLDHKELAYLKYTKYGNSAAYYMVFTKSGNTCTLTDIPTVGALKHVAKMIAGANLVQNNAMSEEEERKFIILHGGSFVKDPATAAAPPPQQEKILVVNNDTKRTIPPADISVKENKIYNNSEMVGVFKLVSEGGNTVISVYNSNDAMVCKATHPDKNDGADWSLVLDGKTVTLLYNSTAPLEKLFKYLAEKGYL